MSKPKKFPEQDMSQPGDEHKMKPQPEYIRKNYRGSDKLKNKVALITGGDSGIGRSVAVHYAREGADVTIIYFNEDKDAKKTKSLVEKEGRKCLLIRGDVRCEEFCKEAVDQCAKKYGKLNILVNNAAVQFPKDKIEDISHQQLVDTFTTNIFH